MKRRRGLSLFAGAAFAVAAIIAGCSSSSGSPAAGVLGGAGESCTRTADCGSGLACIADVCAIKASTGGSVADGGVVFAVDAGAGVTGVDGGGAPEAAPPPRVSDVGESCSSTHDCGAGLVCVPSGSGPGGTCDLASYGLTPTGKTCSGECATGADCCELPLGTTIGAVAVKTCQDILSLVLMGNTTQCTSVDPASNIGVGCFVYSIYCATCATSNVWSCTGNQCVFNLPCQTSGVELGGCPAETRTGRTLQTFCDTLGTKQCNLAPRGICNTGADCDGKGTTDGAGTCRGGDCACYQSGCYTSCASTLDCRQGYGCDATSKVCTKNGVCSSDAQCADQTGVVDAKCVGGACKLPCTSDRECGGSGLLGSSANDAGAFVGKVCGADGFCDDLGCATDADCQQQGHNMNPDGGAVNYFCVTPPPAMASPSVASAITN